eukprot:487368-Prorocentrum_minimum.AAC.2
MLGLDLRDNPNTRPTRPRIGIGSSDYFLASLSSKPLSGSQHSAIATKGFRVLVSGLAVVNRESGPLKP